MRLWDGFVTDICVLVAADLNSKTEEKYRRYMNICQVLFIWRDLRNLSDPAIKEIRDDLRGRYEQGFEHLEKASRSRRQ